jgi:hypothetical protein
VYGGLVALYLVPFWAVPGYLPSTDGPSHVYNSWVLGRLLSPAREPLLREYFAVNRQPVPNCLTHLALIALLRALPPAAAEKTLLSAYVLLAAWALWYLAGAVERERAWLALLGLPFVWNALLGLGFYNFCFSVPLCLLALGLWWRHRDRPGPGFAVLLCAMLVLCYFAHILSAVLALAGIAVLWLASWRRERWRGHLLHLAILAPAAALPVWFTLVRHGEPRVASSESWETLLAALTHLNVLWQFMPEGAKTGSLVAKAFAAWVAFTLAREAVARAAARAPGGDADGDGAHGAGVANTSRSSGFGGWRRRWRRLRPWLREEDGFLALALLLVAVYFFSPEGVAGGSILKPRLEMMPFLVVLPWLSGRLGRWGRVAAVAALAALAVRPVSFAVPCYRAGGRDVEAFVRGLDAVPPDSVVVPLVFDRHTTGCMRTGSVDHATGYAALAKGLIDWDNYEAQTDYFPVRFRPWAVRPTSLDIEGDPAHLQVAALQARVDYIYCWRMPPGAPVAGRLARHCTLVAAGDQWRLYSATPPPRSSDSSTAP